jgi:hypothetical protein
MVVSMSAVVIPLRPDTFIPLRFETPPEDAAQMREEYELATIILEFSQVARNEIYQRGEPLSAPKRQALLAMSFIASDLRP